MVWNPWIDKSKAMADFGDDEYKEMICAEVSFPHLIQNASIKLGHFSHVQQLKRC